jgi:ABC-type nitrate/sulfonate/bicarbonate transport system ATPase subunit
MLTMAAHTNAYDLITRDARRTYVEIDRAMDHRVKIGIQGVSVVYDDNLVLSNLSLNVLDGEIVCLVGASGSGKSTLLNVVAGLVPPHSGSISIDEVPIKGPGPDRVMVFQEDAVFPWMRVFANVEFGLRIKGMPKRERRDRVAQVLKLVELEGRERAYPRELSGGMRKRVDLARALAVDPEILLMDEPYGALDAMTKERMQVHFLAICEQTRLTSLFVTHDLEEALFLGDRIAVLGRNPGRIASVIEVPFRHPRERSLKLDTHFQKLRGQISDLIA